jgi:hypothetical protein
VLSDIAVIAKGHPGVLHEVSVTARQLGHELDVTLDAEFETLFRSGGLDEDYQASQERQTKEVRKLAVRWSSSDPAEVAQRICELETFAAEVGITNLRHIGSLCREIAERVQSPGNWLDTFLENSATPDMIAPFLNKTAETNEAGWQTVVYSCLENASLRGVSLSLVLTLPNPPQRLLSTALAKLEGFSGLVEWQTAVGAIPVETLAHLLRHDDSEISGAAAIGEWCAEPEGYVRGDLLPEWRTAILNARPEEHELGKILKADASLAHAWLLRQIEDGSWLGLRDPSSSFHEAVSVLDREQRLSLLMRLHSNFVHGSLAAVLVGDDLDLYREFLQDDEKIPVQLWPLVGRPTKLWLEKAKLALEAGFSAEEVSRAAYAGVQGWSGSESAMWSDWEQQFATLCTHEHIGIRAAGEAGSAYARERKEQALESERWEAIYGR